MRSIVLCTLAGAPVLSPAPFSCHELVVHKSPAYPGGVFTESGENFVYMFLAVANAVLELSEDMPEQHKEFLLLHGECLDPPLRGQEGGKTLLIVRVGAVFSCQSLETFTIEQLKPAPTRTIRRFL